MSLTNEEIALQYFRLVEKKDIDGVLDLFDLDATIYEPFSKVNGLKGRSSMAPFFKVAMMANTDLSRAIEIAKPAKADKVVAFVTFEKGDKVKGKFTFEFTQDNSSTSPKKIKSLHIEF
jgi:hypothetical protein